MHIANKVFLMYTIDMFPIFLYLDPGAGSYVMQLLIAFLVGSLFAVKLSWRKIVDFFKRLFSKK